MTWQTNELIVENPGIRRVLASSTNAPPSASAGRCRWTAGWGCRSSRMGTPQSAAAAGTPWLWSRREQILTLERADGKIAPVCCRTNIFTQQKFLTWHDNKHTNKLTYLKANLLKVNKPYQYSSLVQVQKACKWRAWCYACSVQRSAQGQISRGSGSTGGLGEKPMLECWRRYLWGSGDHNSLIFIYWQLHGSA